MFTFYLALAELVRMFFLMCIRSSSCQLYQELISIIEELGVLRLLSVLRHFPFPSNISISFSYQFSRTRQELARK